MDYNQKSTRPVDLVFGEAQSGNLNNKDVPTRGIESPRDFNFRTGII